MCKIAKIYQEINWILRYTIPKETEILLLGLTLETIKEEDRTVIWYVLALARTLYAQFWRKREIPIKDWVLKVFYFMGMDRLTKSLDGQDPKDSKRTWDKFKMYLEKILEDERISLGYEIEK